MTVKYNMNSVFSSDLFDELLGGMLDGVSIKTRDMNVTAKQSMACLPIPRFPVRLILQQRRDHQRNSERSR